LYKEKDGNVGEIRRNYQGGVKKMITIQDMEMLSTSFLICGFLLGHSDNYISMAFSIIPFIYGYFKFKDIKREIMRK